MRARKGVTACRSDRGKHGSAVVGPCARGGVWPPKDPWEKGAGGTTGRHGTRYTALTWTAPAVPSAAWASGGYGWRRRTSAVGHRCRSGLRCLRRGRWSCGHHRDSRRGKGDHGRRGKGNHGRRGRGNRGRHWRSRRSRESRSRSRGSRRGRGTRGRSWGSCRRRSRHRCRCHRSRSCCRRLCSRRCGRCRGQPRRRGGGGSLCHRCRLGPPQDGRVAAWAHGAVAAGQPPRQAGRVVRIPTWQPHQRRQPG